LLVGDGASVGRGEAVGLKVTLAVGEMGVSIAAGKVGISLGTGEAVSFAVAETQGVTTSSSAAGVLVGGAPDTEGVSAATDLGKGVEVRLGPTNDVDAGVSVWSRRLVGVEDLVGRGVAVARRSVVPVAAGEEVWASGVL
jgi:hypothetical protein